ncbi:hypothetical protein CAPN001_21320 [Capnocytophaga stomatis]|uniref:hypothetical protein n=1 Tax=Capnocytophaga stomatis TaxID=1848904 RepID=UPI00194E818B|nr:hypothetical protein [Capnocytophaga stomatis]GIJ97563.1 hypothetical protein CAPN001_21320 [Capnocytophaga stomatis]
MTQKELINHALNNTFQKGRISVIESNLRGARFLYETKMQEQTFVEGRYTSNVFSSILLYLIFLEQVGTAFKPKNVHKKNNNRIVKALSYFPITEFPLTSSEKNAIKALRHALAHGMGLVNSDNRLRNPHKFSLHYFDNEVGKIIQLPRNSWDGRTFSDKSEDTNTIIYVNNLIKLAEKIYEKLINENANDNLELAIPEAEFKARFTIN